MSTLRVTCAIIKIQDRILAVQRSATMSLPCKWEFPGGKMEEGESEEACIQREIKEELNIEISLEEQLPATYHEYDDFNIELIPFLAKYQSGKIKLSEHQAFSLLSVNELRSLDWAPADLPIVHFLVNGFE